MLMEEALPSGGAPLSLLAAADLQDHLMTASNDLERLQTLLSGACETLIDSFYGAAAQVQALKPQTPDAADARAFDELGRLLGNAITALQFQDMASQLVHHTNTRLRNCADRLAAETMGDDEDGTAVVTAPPLRPNPVTQDEMDAGSIDLF